MAYETMSIDQLRAIRARLERVLTNTRLSHQNFMEVVGYYVAAGAALETALNGPRG